MFSKPAALHQRYEELAKLGQGNAGVVYLVRDRETGDRLALKRLLQANEASLRRLKSEFRALADISHPNLVKLYELGQDATSAFFTMEYLEGEDLWQHLRTRRQLTTQDMPSLRAPANDAADNSAAHARIRLVLEAFEQLAAGVCALHAAGVLHRDLKPSNVVVSHGRVVVLDFGIALDVGAGDATLTQDKLSAGTPAYMAPEQIHGVHVSTANDWYAFGAMLYEALSGCLPIDGKLIELLHKKQTVDPKPIKELVPLLPSDVAELCMGLLQRNPKERPSGDRVLRVLRAHSRNDAKPTIDTTATLAPFARSKSADELSVFGRDSELSQLRAAYAKTQAGASVAIHVLGESGSGKSQLLRHFCDELASEAISANELQPLILQGVCHERENLPFKALDAAMDALVAHLSRESNLTVGHVLPTNLLALTQLFPVLKTLPATRRLLIDKKSSAGLSQTRAQAESALSDLLLRLGKQQTIVLWLDDLQWGDLDSIGIITTWLGSEYIPRLLLIFSYRSEEIASSPALRMLRQSVDQPASIESQIALAPLTDADIHALCSERFERAGWPASARAQVIARIVAEAAGSPFLASQLATLAISQPNAGDERLASLTLEELVRSLSEALSDGARSLLNVLCVAGRPIPLTLALRAANIERDARSYLHELQSARLIRTRDGAADRLLETYHDRLRETVQSTLASDERAAIDRSLFRALREAGSTDCDWLLVLALALGEREDALRYGLEAAARATEKLAFERAAELYETCVQLSANPRANEAELLHKLAQAYSYAGHGRKAANTYLHAAEQVSAEQRLQFERAAASQLLCSGGFEEGEALFARVLARLGLRAPNAGIRLYAAIGWERLRAALRSLWYRPRDPSQLPFLDKFRTELCGTLSMETAAYFPLRAALFQARCLAMALKLGDTELVGRALCAAATITCVESLKYGRQRADKQLAKAELIANQLDSSLLRTNVASARGICAFLTGQHAEAIELCTRAEHLLRTGSGDHEYQHRFTLATARIASLLELREFRRAETELLAYLREAAATENISAELHACLVHSWIDSNADRARSAIERLNRQRNQLPRVGFGILHTVHMLAVLRIGCMTGEHAWALEVTREFWQTFQRSVIKRSEPIHLYAFEAHARLLLSQAAPGCIDAALSDRASLEKLSLSLARPSVLRIDARIALARRDAATAMQLLAASTAGFEEAGAHDDAARDRFALGALQGGEEGKALQQAALLRLAELGIAAPHHDVRGFFPELSHAASAPA